MILEGAVGVEVAGKIKMQHPNTRVTLIHSRGQLLSNEPLPDEFKAQALALLEAEGVEVILNERPNIVKLPDQRQRIQMKLKQMTTSHVFWATSRTIPSTSFIPENFLNKNGCLSVDEQ
jgi:NADH dehydrogenase FAD-containing subunit